MNAVSEQDIIELQTQLAFQEDLLEQLNQALSSQQQELLHLQSQISFLVEELKQQKDQTQHNNGDYSRLLENERPPHY